MWSRVTTAPNYKELTKEVPPIDIPTKRELWTTKVGGCPEGHAVMISVPVVFYARFQATGRG